MSGEVNGITLENLGEGGRGVVKVLFIIFFFLGGGGQSRDIFRGGPVKKTPCISTMNGVSDKMLL